VRPQNLYSSSRSKGALLAACSSLLIAWTQPADARITAVTNCTTTSPYGSTPFGSVGTYQQLACTANGAVDPNDPLNAIIQDIQLAPKVGGLVQYSMDVTILMPTDLSKSNHVMLFDVPNRGNRLLPGGFNIGGSTTSAGDGFLHSQGFIMVASGWQGDVLPGGGRLTMTVPVAQNPGGGTIIGRVHTEYGLTAGPATTQNLGSGPYTGTTTASYETISLNNSGAVLTQRVHQDDPRELIPNNQWAFADCSTTPFPGTPSTTQICLNGGFDTNHIYELIYTAKNPTVLGLGFAAMRDLASFLRNDTSAENPLTGAIQTAIMYGVSQTGRTVRTFLDLGFNEDEDHKMVFDGMNPHIATARIPLNVRFGAPGRAAGTQHQEKQFPGSDSPMSWSDSPDPLTGEDAGILDRCLATNTCPKIFQTVSGTEYWQSAMSNDTTDFSRDLPIPSNIRIFYLSSTQHGGASVTATPETNTMSYCQYFLNINPYIYNTRALLTDLTAWVVDGTSPPSSRYPTVADGTLVPANRIGFPKIPGVNFTALYNSRQFLYRGQQFDFVDMSGILTEPPIEVDDYNVLVPRVDLDGLDVAGVRSVAVSAPIGTNVPWNYRAAGFGEGDLCDLSGSFFAFATTKAQRLANGDPRLSLQERYDNHQGYVDAVSEAAEDLVADRLLLPADADSIIAAAQASNVLQ
jgi:Alpha/beta hydrolase domain